MRKRYLPVAFAIILILVCATLFSCKKECSHMNMIVSVTEPTHTEQGYTTNVCTSCKYTFVSNYTPPIGHALSTSVHAPTCIEQGYTHYSCECGYAYDSDFVPALGHTMSVTEVLPTCDTEGYKIADCCVCQAHHTYDIKPPIGHDIKTERTFVSVSNQTASTHYTCGRCDLDYHGDHVFYHDIYKGAYIDSTEILAKGLDVSYHNHEKNPDGTYTSLDWEYIKSKGYEFVILRAGYMGSGNALVTDPVFEKNYLEAKAAGFDVGVYFYSYAYSLADAKLEAEALLTLLEGKQFEYPIFFDIEHSEEEIVQNQLTPEDLTDICIEFISILQDNGYFGALYSNNEWLTVHLETSKVTTLFDIWYARYDSNTDIIVEDTWDTERYGKQMAMWQFSETGIIEGVYYTYQKDENGNAKQISFDMNYAYKDYPTIIKDLGLNGYVLDKDLSELDKQ